MTRTRSTDATAPVGGQDARWWQAEENHINVVPETERHGRPSSLFYVWFAASLGIGTVVTGALAVIVGNTTLWALVAVVVGNVLGGWIVAAHSAQGPVLGVPQMIQSRGQFGLYGALLPLALAMVLYIGFFAFGAIPAAQSLHEVDHGIGQHAGVWIIAIPSLLIAALGYHVIHYVQRVTTFLTLIGLVVLTGAVVAHGDVSLTTSGFQAGSWLLAVAIVAVYQISVSPYVSDYSRYLPVDIGYRKPFWFTFAGTGLGATWAMVLGVVVTAQFAKLGTVQAITSVAGDTAWLVQLALALAIVGINAMNLYGGMLSLLTAVSAFRDVPRGAALRVAGIVATFAAGLSVALAASAHFFQNFQNFLLFLVYVLIPWTAINLVDFYVVRKGRYDVPAFFDRRGIFMRDPANRFHGGFSLIAMASYAIGFLSELPFINTTYFTGWAVDVLGGADISWVVGLIVTVGVFLAMTRVLSRGVVAVDEQHGERQRVAPLLEEIAHATAEAVR